MLTLLIISSSFIISYAGNNCPVGTSQVGNRGAVGNGQVGPTLRGPSVTLDSCKSNCESMPYCRAFNYDNNFYGQPQCIPYGQPNSFYSYPSGAPGGDQVLCVFDASVDVACPAGTTQIGGQGAAISTYDSYARLQYFDQPNFILTEESCSSKCQANFNCRAFTYDNDQFGGSNPNPTARCSLYRFNQQVNWGNNDYGDISPFHPNADQILCGLDSRANAESPGLFSLDGVDENGETIQLSVYVIYGVIGLVLVNIICLCIHYWNKCTKGSNKRRYKVVSMRSDTDTDIENQ